MSSVAIPAVNPSSPEWSEYLDSQLFNLTDLQGNPVTFSLTTVRTFVQNKARAATVYAFGIGFCSMLTIVLLLLTDRKKLRTPIYFLNITSLIIYTFRSGLI